MINPNFCVSRPPRTQHHRFFRNYPPCLLGKIKRRAIGAFLGTSPFRSVLHNVVFPDRGLKAQGANITSVTSSLTSTVTSTKMSVCRVRCRLRSTQVVYATRGLLCRRHFCSSAKVRQLKGLHTSVC